MLVTYPVTSLIRLFSTLVILSLSRYGGVAQAQDEFKVFSYWQNLPDYSNNLYQIFVKDAEAKLNARSKTIAALQSQSDWITRQLFVRSTLDSIMGSFPDKTPLHPKITGRIDHEKYLIEKLHFQSRPNFYVTAALFLPKNILYPAPAILFCSGHAAEGFRSPTYQHMILNYVQKGFIVLAFDPIGQGERYQYFDQQGQPYLGPTKEHSKAGNQVFITGLSPANYFVWDGIRALDYLMQRPEVDPERIGVTGRSGGGTQTAYLMAYDERIAAAAPECYLTTFDRLLKSRGPQDAEQNLMYFLDALDLPDLVQVRAPKPTLVITTTEDIFPISGARDLFDESQHIYEAFNQSSHLAMVEDHAGHQSTSANREAAYAFFRKHLNHPGDTSDEPVDTLPPQSLWITEQGQVVKDLGSETIFSLNKAMSNQIMMQRDRQAKEASYYEQLPKVVAKLLQYRPPKEDLEIVYSGTFIKEGIQVEKYLLGSKESYFIPLIKLAKKTSEHRAVLVLDEEGKSRPLKKDGLAWLLARRGFSVFLPDLSGLGEMGGGYHGGDARLSDVPINVWYGGILVNQSPVAVRIKELKWIKDFMRANSANSTTEMDIIARGYIGADVLHAAALGVQFKRTILVNSLVSYQSILDTSDYLPKWIMSAVAGSHEYYDLSHLSSFCSDLLLINPMTASGDVAKDGSVNTYSSIAPMVEVQMHPRGKEGELFASILAKLGL